jgi:hypothetical protein
VWIAAAAVPEIVATENEKIMKRLTFLATLVSLGTAFALHASAQSCDAMLNDIVNWITTQPNGPGSYTVAFTAVTNRSDGLYASYLEAPTLVGTPSGSGTLTYHPPYTIGGWFFPAYLQGDMAQFFSDRRYAPYSSPFDPSKTDKTRVTISLGTYLGVQFGQVTFTLLSWANAQLAFMPSCQNGLMYGFIDNTMVVMSLNKKYNPPIR